MLQLALRQATVPSAETSPAATTAAAAAAAAATAAATGPRRHAAAAARQQLQQQQQHPTSLRLAHFRSDAADAVSLLDDLPAHSLTALDLHFKHSISHADSAPLSAALARLSRLQDLKLSCKGWPLGLHASCLASIPQLTQLTALHVKSQLSGGRARLQRRLQQLTQPLLLLRDLAHLNQLEDLVLIDGLPQGIVLPLQLTALALSDCHCGLDVAPLLPLQQFGVVAFDSAPQLLQLSAALPALQHLSLRYCDPRDAAEAARAWPHLPALQELSLEYEVFTPTPSQLEAILQGVAASTRLTQLQLAAAVLASEHVDASKDAAVPAAACAHLAGLKKLRELRFSQESILVPGDALALTALAGLTRLELQKAGDADDDTAATALACCLKQLRHLDLRECGLGSMACLAAIAQLQELTELRLEGNGGLTERGLMLLTGLSQLQQLGVSSDQLPDAVVASFWAALRQQQQ